MTEQEKTNNLLEYLMSMETGDQIVDLLLDIYT